MAVARHSENIEVQNADYENETTVTARRTNVEMSEEGHYESLDRHKIDDAVYGDLRTKKKSGIRPFRVVVGVAVCLGILCLIMGVIIAQGVHYRSPCSNSMTNDTLVHHYNTLKSSYDTLTLNYTQINILNSNLTQEKNRLESDNTNLNREKDLLQSEVNQLKTADRPCPSGWTKFGCSCYYRTTGVKSWQGGRDECQSLGADLVVINSREKQVFIRGLYTEGDGSWIGLTRTQGWTWVDGTPLTTAYWGTGWPRNDGYWNCAAYGHRTDPGIWGNNACSGLRASICETK